MTILSRWDIIPFLLISGHSIAKTKNSETKSSAEGFEVDNYLDLYALDCIGKKLALFYSFFPR